MKETINPCATQATRAALWRVLWLWLVLWLPLAGSARADDQATRRPTAERLEELRNRREFRYDRNARPPDNLVARFFGWLGEWLAPVFRNQTAWSASEYVFLTGMAVLVVWLLHKADLMGNVFGRSAWQPPLPYTSLTDNIHAINFRDRLDEALRQQNYRLAVRLLYLQTLKHLTDRRLIAWQPDKTNRSYVYELADSPLRGAFERLTQQFEFVWYGDFPVTEAQFAALRQEFDTFAGADTHTRPTPSDPVSTGAPARKTR